MHVATKQVFKRSEGKGFHSCHSQEHIHTLELGEMDAVLRIMSGAPGPYIPVVTAHQASLKLTSSRSEEEGISSSIEQAERKRGDFTSTFPAMYDGG